MSGECPSCGTGDLGNQIVELTHGTTDDVTYGCICSECSTVYASKQAREQMGEIKPEGNSDNIKGP